MRAMLAKLGLIPLGVLLGLLGMELLLQAGAGVRRLTGPASDSTPSHAGQRVLCVGDSNTYGVHVSREEAYPQKLEALWNRRPGNAPLDVVNLGVPGANSSRLVNEFPRMLDSVLPDLAIVMVGVNDYWTQPVPRAAESSGRRLGLGDWLWRHSRLYRVYRTRSVPDPEAIQVVRDSEGKWGVGASHRVRIGEEEFDMGWSRRSAPIGESSLVENLTTLMRQARERGAQVLLMTYPSGRRLYPRANREIREAAASTGTTLVDLTALFESACPDEACEELLLPDGHPNVRGYSLVAEALARRLPELLEP